MLCLLNEGFSGLKPPPAFLGLKVVCVQWGDPLALHCYIAALYTNNLRVSGQDLSREV